MTNKKDSYTVTINVKITDPNALKKLSAEMERIAVQQKKLTKGSAGVAAQTKKTQIAMRSSGRGLQNFSYQMQDIIVQTSGGVDIMRSLSQQLPQMLVNMGAFGAVVGVAAAALPLLISAFMGAEEESIKFTEAISELDEAIGRLTEVSTTVDFSGWDKAWNEASESVRETMLALLEFNVALAKVANSTALQSLQSEISKGIDPSWLDVMITKFPKLAYVISLAKEDWNEFVADIKNSGLEETLSAQELALDTFALSWGTTAEVVKFVQDIMKDGTTYDEALLILKLAESAERATPAFMEYARGVLAAAQAEEDLAAALDRRDRARAGEDMPGQTGELKEVDAQTKFKLRASAAAEAAVALNDYNQQQRIFIEYQEELVRKAEEAEAALAAEAEALTLSAQAADLFESSFDTALNGVMMGTQKMEDAFKNMAKGIIAHLLKIIAYKTIAGFTGGTFGGQLAFADGGVVQGGVQKFANGGIVSSPTLFPMKKGMGLMGEGAGPEAIVPLTRGSGGQLGVQSSPVAVTVNNLAPGVAVNTRKGEDGGLTLEIVMAQVANAIGQGGNSVANAMEKTYSLGRGRATY